MDFTEVRILGRYQYSGYFKSVDNLIQAIEPFVSLDDEQLYFVLNKIDQSCYGRQQSERIVKSPKITTNDNDIVRRHWVLCDFDPIRKSGTNASNKEFKFAHEKSQDVFRFLRDNGFNDPVVCKSGNGWHLLYHIDEPVNEETTEIIKGFFKFMGQKFSDDKVEFDEKNFNAARLCKLYGTMAKKGANIDERPWRMSEIVYVPKDLKPTDIGKFKELADLVPKDETKPQIRQNTRLYGQSFDLVAWLNQHGIGYRVKQSGGSTIYELEACPWIDSHSDHKKWDSALFVDSQGKITFNCTHSHCKGKTWQDVRLFYEPTAYDKPVYQPIQYKPYTAQQKPRYEIKDVSPELGEKWMSMSSIKKVDLGQIGGVKTGFVELDRNIVQLNDSEVTLLSGSNSSGKSSLLNTLILNVIQQGTPSALWSGELPAPILKAWIQMVAAGRANLRLSSYGDGKYYVPQNIGERIDEWLDGKFFLYNNEYGCQWEQIFHDMSELVKIGVRFFVLDNLFSLNIDLLEGDRNNKQKELILQIKDFAKKNNIHIILVAHPRKTMAFLRKNDISGTSDLTNAVDNVLIIHRVNNDFFRSGADFFGQAEIQRFQGFGNVIEVAKNRMYGVVDLMVGLHYEVESRRFKNTVDENVRYGWELPTAQPQIQFVHQPSEQTNPSMPFGETIHEEAPF